MIKTNAKFCCGTCLVKLKLAGRIGHESIVTTFKKNRIEERCEVCGKESDNIRAIIELGDP